MDTTQLVLRAQNGDQRAFDELYYYSYKPAYSVAYKMTNSEQDAYDIMQEAYFKAFANLDLLTDKSGFIPWFNRIVTNKTKDFLRSRKNVILFSDMTYDNGEGELEPDFEDESTAFQPEEHTDYIETKRIVNDALDNLPPEQKLVLMMYYIQNMSIREIAEALGVSENTVKSRMSYGKKKLYAQKDELEKKGVKLRVSTAALIPFLIWMLREMAEGMPVHQMSPATLQAAQLAGRGLREAGNAYSQANQQGYHAVQTAATAGKAVKHTGRIIAIVAASAVALAAGAFAFFAWGLPALTGNSNVVSQIVNPEPARDPNTLVDDFVDAINEHDADKMADIFLPENKDANFMKAKGLFFAESFVQFSMDVEKGEMKMDGDKASCHITFLPKLAGYSTSQFLGDYGKIQCDMNFVKKDGKWYIVDF